MLAVLVEVILGLWWVAITSTVATVVAMRAAWFGVIPKMIGALGASALGCVAVSYWLDILDVGGASTVDMRRGAALILWPSIAWVVVSLTVNAGRHAQ